MEKINVFLKKLAIYTINFFEVSNNGYPVFVFCASVVFFVFYKFGKLTKL